MRRATVTILLVGLLAALPVTAQQTEEERQEQQLDVQAREFIYVEGSLPFVPDSNTIVTKLPLPLELTPNNVGLVTRALFSEQNGLVLGDALRNVSNVNVQPGFGVHDYFVVRGFDSLSSGLILTDGAPEPEATFYQLYNVELVEVLKGPAGFLYGSNPLAGAVNLVRKQPQPARSLRLSAMAGSFDTFDGNVDGNWASADRRLMGRVNAMFRDAGSWRDGKNSTALALNPALTWRPDDVHTLNLNLEYGRSDYTPEAGIPVLLDTRAPVDDATDYNSPRDRSEQDILRFQADWEARLSDRVTVRNKLYYRGLDWISEGTLLSGIFPVPNGDLLVARTQIQLDDEQDFLGNQLEAVWELDTGEIRHDLLTGVEVTRMADAFTLDVGLLDPVALLSPMDAGRAPTPIPGQSVIAEPRSLVFAPYAVDQVTLSERVQLLAGLRLDIIDFSDDLTFRDRNDSELSPMLGGVWLPADDVSVYSSYSRSFAPPSARAFGQPEPEKSEQIEAGVKVRFLGDRGRATAAVYTLERDNIAIPDDNGFTQQIGNQRSRGFELELAAEPGNGYRAVASYAYNDAELTQFAELLTVPTPTGELVPVVFDRSGNRPAFAPEHLFDVWASRTFVSGLGVGLGGRYMGEQFIDEDNLFVIDDAFVVSGMVSYEWAGYRMSLNVQNATDTDYLTRAFGSGAVTPAAPLSAFVRVSIRP